MKKLFLVVGLMLAFSLSSISLWASGENETSSQPQPRQQPQQTAQQQTSIQGAWEIRSNGVLWVISFIDDTFAVFRNGELSISGICTTNPSSWGVNVTSNSPRNLYMEYGLERAFQGLTYTISNNELTLSDTGWRSIQYSGYLTQLPLGTYKRSTEPSEAGNPLIGLWRQDFKNDEGKNATEILRFYPNGQGILFNYLIDRRNLNDDNMAIFITFKYELGTTTGTGQISFLDLYFDWVDGNYTVVSEIIGRYPFVINGNVFRMELENGTSEEYRKR